MIAQNFKLKDCRFRLCVWKKFLYNESDETMKHVQRNCGYPIPESVQGRLDEESRNLI